MTLYEFVFGLWSVNGDMKTHGAIKLIKEYGDKLSDKSIKKKSNIQSNRRCHECHCCTGLYTHAHTHSWL